MRASDDREDSTISSRSTTHEQTSEVDDEEEDFNKVGDCDTTPVLKRGRGKGKRTYDTSTSDRKC